MMCASDTHDILFIGATLKPKQSGNQAGSNQLCAGQVVRNKYIYGQSLITEALLHWQETADRCWVMFLK